MDCIPSHSEGGAGDDEMVPCSPSRSILGAKRKGLMGGERGGVKNGSTLFPSTSLKSSEVAGQQLLSPQTSSCDPGNVALFVCNPCMNFHTFAQAKVLLIVGLERKDLHL